MRKRKSRAKLDKVEENFQSLKTGGSRGLKSVSFEFNHLRQDLNLFATSLPPRLRAPFEKSLGRLDNVERKLSNLENMFKENFEEMKESYLVFKSKLEEIEDEKGTLKILYELSNLMYSEKDVDTLLDMVTDALVDLVGAERSFLIVFDENKSIKLKVGKNRDKESIEDEDINQNIIEAVLETGDAIFVSNLLVSENEEKDKSFKQMSVLCIPLNSREQTNAVFYLDHSEEEALFTMDDVDLCLSLAEKVALSLESNLLFRELRESQEKVLKDLRGKFKFDEILGDSSQMVEILRTVAEVADTDATVLIEGESGTGKELLARAVHFNSGRFEKPFVAINCAAIPETLLESELFGYEKGAFTGAEQRKLGKFEQCDEGTIFLDEIGDMSLLTQSKILRILERQEFERLGGEQTIKINVRIISATNKDLLAMVKENRFREDLYYRINVINLKLPPLRERRSDIEVLANFFVSKFAKREKKKIGGIEQEAMNFLCRYSFPGNVRELENIIERAVILTKGDCILLEDLPQAVIEGSPHEAVIKTPQNYAELKAKKKKLMEKTEEDFLKYILSKYNNNISRAAKEAKMHRVELQRLVKKHRK